MPQFRPAALRFFEAVHDIHDPVAVLDAVQEVSRHRQLNTFCAWYLPQRSTDIEVWKCGRTIFFRNGFDGQTFLEAYCTQINSHGGVSPLGTHTRTHSEAFTIAEAMREVRGKANWITGWFRRYDFRDGLICPCRNWAMCYQSQRVLILGSIDRALLAAVAAIAIGQISVLTPGVERLERGKIALTRTEQTILQFYSRGLTDKDIAAQMKISVLTVKTHFQNMRKKFKAEHRGQLIAEAMRRGLIV